MKTYDVIVVGGGAAGLSGALALVRSRRSVLVVDDGTPRNAPAEAVHNFLTRDGVPPAELYAIGRQEVAGYGGEFATGTVTAVRRDELFTVELADGTTYQGRRLLVTTGLTDVLPDVRGLAERWGRDVLHCPYCHGHEVADQPLGVLGGAPETVRYAQIVRQWSHDVVLFIGSDVLTDGQRTELAARGLGVVEGAVGQVLVEEDRLCGVAMTDGRTVARAALFVPPRFVPNNALLAALGCAVDEGGWVVTGPAGSTSVPGVWVAGNVANPKAQVVTAAGEGSAAAIDLNAHLVDEDVQVAAGDAPQIGGPHR